MLPSTTAPIYSSSNANNQLVFPPLTPASGMSTQELRVPTTYQVESHTDQRETPSGTNALCAMYVNSEDRHSRQRNGFDDRHHRRESRSDDRHHRCYGHNDDRHHRGRSRSEDRYPRQRSKPDDRYHRQRSRSDYRHHRDSGHSEFVVIFISTSIAESTWTAFPGSRVVPARQLNSQMTAYQRMLKLDEEHVKKC